MLYTFTFPQSALLCGTQGLGLLAALPPAAQVSWACAQPNRARFWGVLPIRYRCLRRTTKYGPRVRRCLRESQAIHVPVLAKHIRLKQCPRPPISPSESITPRRIGVTLSGTCDCHAARRGAAMLRAIAEARVGAAMS